MKKNILVLIGFTILIMFSGCENDIGLSYVDDSQTELTVGNVSLMDKQKKGNENFQKLINSFSVEKGTLSILNYPEYYGGSYMSENGEMIVNFIGDSITVRENIEDIIGNPYFDIRRCTYSYRDLTAIMDKLNKFMFDETNKSFINEIQLHGFYLSDKNNIIGVKLGDCSKENIDKFKRVGLDSPAITFEVSPGFAKVEIDVNPGYSVSGTYGFGSVGYRVESSSWPGVRGIIVSGHMIAVGGTLSYGGTAIGYCENRQFGGSVDAAFCEITNSSYTPTNSLGSYGTLSTVVEVPWTGTVVNKLGSVTFNTAGTVISTSVTATFEVTPGNYITLSDLVSATYDSASGDSGGVVYSPPLNTTLGIHEGADPFLAYFVKAGNINSSLSVYRY